MHQAIIWTKGDQVYCNIYASCGLDKFVRTSSVGQLMQVQSNTYDMPYMDNLAYLIQCITAEGHGSCLLIDEI